MEQTQGKKLHIKTGDTVYVISGKEKGKRGKVLRILKNKGTALVEKLNIVKRHSRPTPKSPGGGIVEKESGIHISNLMVYCPKCGSPSKTGRKTLGSGEKVRYCKKCEEEIKS